MGLNVLLIVNLIRGFSDKEGEFLEHFGSFIGGYVGSLFSLGAMLLLIATLKAQRHSSEEQSVSAAHQSFEAKYFELLKLHRENVTEMSVGSEATNIGRLIFVHLLWELRQAVRIIKENVNRSGVFNATTTFQIAYYAVFYGVGPNSSRMLRSALHGLGIETAHTERVIRALEVNRTIGNSGGMFDGYQSRLGHYYRHLYQMVRYIDQQTIPTLDRNRKYEYVKTVRAQLSTHEQALLLLNSLTPMGDNWWKNNLITTYRLVQNIPEEFFNASEEFEFAALFPTGYFEWQEFANDRAKSSPVLTTREA